MSSADVCLDAELFPPFSHALSQAVPDLTLDVPAAEGLLMNFVTRGKRDGYLPKDFLFKVLLHLFLPTWRRIGPTEHPAQDPSAQDIKNMAEFQAPVPPTSVPTSCCRCSSCSSNSRVMRAGPRKLIRWGTWR